MRGIAAGPLWQCRSIAPTRSSATSAARDSGGSGTVVGYTLASAMIGPLSVEVVSGGGFAGGALRGHRIFVRVQHPARLRREIDARRAEDVDENIEVGIDGLRGMNGRRR